MDFTNDFKTLTRKLDFQRERILSKAGTQFPGFPLAVHDADFYTILLRRILRRLSKLSKSDKRVKEILVRNSELLRKVKVRDHFEHPETFNNFPTIEISKLPQGTITGEGSVQIVASVLGNKDQTAIVSGEFIWDLHNDHEQIIRIVREAISLPEESRGNDTETS